MDAGEEVIETPLRRPTGSDVPWQDDARLKCSMRSRTKSNIDWVRTLIGPACRERDA